MWGYLLFVAGCLVVSLFWDPPWDRKPRSTQAPYVRPNLRPKGFPGRFVHRGGYHNRYWTTGNLNRTRPWIRNIR